MYIDVNDFIDVYIETCTVIILLLPMYTAPKMDVFPKVCAMPNEKSLKNLRDRSAPDNPGETGTLTVRLSLADLEWIKAQPEGASYHIRQAIKMYRASKK